MIIIRLMVEYHPLSVRNGAIQGKANELQPGGLLANRIELFAVFEMSNPKNANLIGRNVARLRYQKGWTQNTLVAKIQIRGCYMTRDILANIESRRSSVNDRQIAFLADALGVEINDLFPQKRHLVGVGFNASGKPTLR